MVLNFPVTEFYLRTGPLALTRWLVPADKISNICSAKNISPRPKPVYWNSSYCSISKPTYLLLVGYYDNNTSHLIHVIDPIKSSSNRTLFVGNTN